MDKAIKNLFIFAGEPSGDLHGSHLARSLQKLQPDLCLEGVPGPQMRFQGVTEILRMEDFEVMGLSDVILALPRLYRHFHKICSHILATKPEGVILIDYPGFNLRLAKSLRKKGYAGKIIQYISPTVWAHGKHRIDSMAKTLDLLLTIYPFESKCYSHTGLKVDYVGNPLCEYIKQYQYAEDWRSKTGIPEKNRLIALFPGSRKGEIERNLPFMLEAAETILQNNPEMGFGISCANLHVKDYLKRHPFTDSSRLREAIFYVPKEYTYELMRDSHSAIAKSGTVTLELALHQRPTVVVYKLTTLNRLYAKHILKLKLPYYCIVNILAESMVFPELIECGLNTPNLVSAFQAVDDAHGTQRANCLEACNKIALNLAGKAVTSENAAKSIQRLLEW